MRRVAILLALGSVGCQTQPLEPSFESADLFSDGGALWIDMTHVYDQNTIFWPTAEPFELEIVADGFTDGGYYYAANNFCSAEHGGTHLDAPVHFAQGRKTTDQIDLERLVGPAVVVDVTEAVEIDPDYQVQVDDLERWESRNGAMPAGAIVLVETGWGRHWPDRGKYLGTTRRGPEAVSELHFPGIDPEAARWLVKNRRVDAVGIDTASIDHGPSTAFETHRILLGENIPAFENVASLDALPDTGAYVIALPMKIGGGTGGPLRIVGVVPSAGR